MCPLLGVSAQGGSTVTASTWDVFTGVRDGRVAGSSSHQNLETNQSAVRKHKRI